MVKSQRLNGLYLLKDIGVPIPEIQVVESREDVNKLNIYDAEYGWTIRTCRTDGQMEMGLYYLNNATKEQLNKALELNYDEYQRRYAYIVYPSWEFVFSCNIIFVENDYLIEGANSSQKKISMGKSIPDFALNIPYGMRSRMVNMIAEPSLEFMDQLGRILYYCKTIPLPDFYVECAYTSRGDLIFYDLFEINTRNMHF